MRVEGALVLGQRERDERNVVVVQRSVHAPDLPRQRSVLIIGTESKRKKTEGGRMSGGAGGG